MSKNTYKKYVGICSVLFSTLVCVCVLQVSADEGSDDDNDNVSEISGLSDFSNNGSDGKFWRPGLGV